MPTSGSRSNSSSSRRRSWFGIFLPGSCLFFLGRIFFVAEFSSFFRGRLFVGDDSSLSSSPDVYVWVRVAFPVRALLSLA